MKAGGRGGDDVRGRRCFYCHRPGHTIKQCRARSACFRCGREGHLVRDCPEPETGQEVCPFNGCRFCGETGHWRKNCEIAKAVSAVGVDLTGLKYCIRCQKYGHHQKYCRQDQQLSEQLIGVRPEPETQADSDAGGTDCQRGPDQDGFGAEAFGVNEIEVERFEGGQLNRSGQLVYDHIMDPEPVTTSPHPLFAIHQAYVYVPLHPSAPCSDFSSTLPTIPVHVPYMGGWGGSYPYGSGPILQGPILPLVAHAPTHQNGFRQPTQYGNGIGGIPF